MESGTVQYSGYEVLLAVERSLTNYNAFIVDKIAVVARPGMEILDFGAGIGTLAWLLQTRGIDPLCFEPDAGQVDILVVRGLRCTPSLDHIADHSLDLIYSSNVLEHIADDEAQLLALARKLKSGGRLFLYLPAMMVLFSQIDVEIGHYRRYTKSELSAKLLRAGLKSENAYYADVIGFFATLCLKLLRANSSSLNSVRGLRFYDRILFPATCKIESYYRFPFGKNLFSISSLECVADIAR